MSYKYTYVTNYNDWCGLYRDGKLILEGHELHTEDILKELLDNDYEVIVREEDTFEDFGNRLPLDLQDYKTARGI